MASTTALRDMIARIDAGHARGNSGYVTYIPEVPAILNELSKRVPVGIVAERQHGTTINVTLTIGFTLDETELDAIEAEQHTAGQNPEA